MLWRISRLARPLVPVCVGLGCLILPLTPAGRAADDLPDVVTVCEVLAAPRSYQRKAVFLLGRISKRENGRWIGEDSCAGREQTGDQNELAVRFDRQGAPLPPDNFVLNKRLAQTKFGQIAQHTQLRDFKFGSGDYDRWGMVFGRVEPDDPLKSGTGAEILCRGEALIFLWGGPVQ